VPLSKLQEEILTLLAAHRDPESYVAGSTPLNREPLAIPVTLIFFMTARHGLPAPLKKIALSCRRMVFPCNGSGGNSTFTLFSCGVATRPPNSNGWLIVTSGFFRPCPTSFLVMR
jgi:hypothetical protein